MTNTPDTENDGQQPEPTFIQQLAAAQQTRRGLLLDRVLADAVRDPVPDEDDD